MFKRHLVVCGVVFLSAGVLSFFGFSPTLTVKAPDASQATVADRTSDRRKSARAGITNHQSEKQELIESLRAVTAAGQVAQAPPSTSSFDKVPVSMTPYEKLAMNYESFFWMRTDIGLGVTKRIYEKCRTIEHFPAQIKLLFDATVGQQGAIIRNPRVMVLNGAPLSSSYEHCIIQASGPELRFPLPRGWRTVPAYEGQIEHVINMGGSS